MICSPGHVWSSGRITRRCGARHDVVPELVVEEANGDHLLRQPSTGAPTPRLHASPHGPLPIARQPPRVWKLLTCRVADRPLRPQANKAQRAEAIAGGRSEEHT